MGQKAGVGNDPLQLGSTETGVILHLLPDDPPDPPGLSLPHQQRHPGHDGAEDIITF